MSTRPLSAFAWRKTLAPALIAGAVTAIIVAPITFTLLFGVLPPFWGGISEGVWNEAGFALQVTTGVARNALIGVLREILPVIPRSWMGGDWIAVLRDHGVYMSYLIRSGATLLATAWVVGVIAFRTYRRTGRIRGFEHVDGPLLFEGTAASRQASSAMASERKDNTPGIYIAPNIQLTKAREILSYILFGMQETGKTTIIKFLIHQLIKKPNTKIILFDHKGDFTASWPNSDVIFFAPHDRRTSAWDIGADVTNEIAAQEFAATILPANGNEPVWALGGRQVIEAVIIAMQKKYGRDWGFQELLHALQCSPVELRDIVESVRPETKSFIGIDENGEFTKTSIGYITNIQAHVLPLIRPLALSWGLLPTEKRISLRSWVYDDTPSAQTIIMQNNITVKDISMQWMRQVIKRLSTLTGSSSFPDDPDRRIWFILDEFPQLKHMPDLLDIPATHRSKGAMLVLTAQSVDQIYDIYGLHGSNTLINLMQTKIMKPGQESDLCTRINRWIGKVRWRDPRENGINANGQRVPITEREDDLLTPSYLSTLGPGKEGVSGLILGIGPNVFRVTWPYQKWPDQRQAVCLAPWME